MMEYVTLEDVKRHLQIVETDETQDEYLRLLIFSASAIVKNYLKHSSAYQALLDDDDEPTLDSNFEPVLDSFSSGITPDKVRYEVRVAVLLMIGELYLNREGGGNYSNGTLPPAVSAILYPLRDPQLK